MRSYQPVGNPAPGGGISNSLNLTISNTCLPLVVTRNDSDQYTCGYLRYALYQADPNATVNIALAAGPSRAFLGMALGA